MLTSRRNGTRAVRRFFAPGLVAIFVMGLSATLGVLPASASTVVASVAVPSNGTYIAGQNLDFIVTYSAAVTVIGTPRIPVTLDIGGTVYASYISGSGTNDITFQLTLRTGEQDNNGITIGSSIDLNGGTIEDGASSNADLTLNSVGSTAGVNVDAIVPVVTSVVVPPNATYVAGQFLDFTIDFSKNVNVDASGGTPTLAITLDTGGTVDATYISGSGTSSLAFEYVVAAGNGDSNGITLGSTIGLHGGTIRDVDGNGISTTLNGVGSTTGVLVDAIAPVVNSITTVEPASNNLTSEDFLVTFSESVTGVDAGDFSLVTTGTVGGTIASVTPQSSSTYNVNVNLVSGVGTLGIDLNAAGSGIADLATNSLTTSFSSSGIYTFRSIATTLPSGTVLSSSLSPSTSGQTVIFTASVVGLSPTGIVTFYLDGSPVSAATVNGSGIATFSTSTLGVGSHSVLAAYGGDTNNAASVSSFITDVVNAAPPVSTIAPLATSPTTTLSMPPPLLAPMPTKKPKVSVDSMTIARTSAGIPVTFSCDDASCSGSAQLVKAISLKVKTGATTVVKTTTVILATRQYSLGQGKRSTIYLAITTSGKGALAKATVKSPVSASVIFTVKGGNKATKMVKVG